MSGLVKISTVLVILGLLFIGGGVSYFIAKNSISPFGSLSKEGMHQRIIEERDLAIQKAVESGDYRCCITPPCTMCYMEANQWNNNKAGTCACDDLIAQGKEPCPQCKQGLCEENDNGACIINQKK